LALLGRGRGEKVHFIEKHAKRANLVKPQNESLYEWAGREIVLFVVDGNALAAEAAPHPVNRKNVEKVTPFPASRSYLSRESQKRANF